MKKLFTLCIIAASVFGYKANAAVTCDTILNLQSTTDTLTMYLTGNGGYLSGNNGYGDLFKAEQFTNVPGDHVVGALLLFGAVTVANGDSGRNVTVYVWNDNGSGPGTAVDSATLTLKDIADVVSQNTGQINAVNYVQFTHNAAISSSNFYVGVALPTHTGDTIAFITNTENGGDGKGWEAYDNGGTLTWGDYQTDWGLNGPLGNYIVAEICSSLTTGLSSATSSLNASIYPNPASDVLNINWASTNGAEVAVYDLTGQLVKTTTIGAATQTQLDVHQFASGAYIVKVTDKISNEQQSFRFNKM